MLFLFSSISFALSMLDATNGVLGRSSFHISGNQETLDLEILQYRDVSFDQLTENDSKFFFQVKDVQSLMNQGEWEKAAEIWHVFMKKSELESLGFVEDGIFHFDREVIKSEDDVQRVLHNYSLQTWYIICLTRAGRHFEAKYQLHQWAESLGIPIEDSSKAFPHSFRKENSVQNWFEAMTKDQEDHQITSDTQEMIIWLLSEYRILLSWVEGENGEDRISLQHARQAERILDEYLVFQSKNKYVDFASLQELQKETKGDRAVQGSNQVKNPMDTIEIDMEEQEDHLQNNQLQKNQLQETIQKSLIQYSHTSSFYEDTLFAIDILEMRSLISLRRHKRASQVLEHRKNMSFLDLDDAWLWYELGIESLWKGDDEEGLIYLERAIHSKYSSPLHVQVLFMQLVERQNFSLALRFIVDGIRRFPNSNLLSMLLQEMENPDLQAFWEKSSRQPERKWVRAIWGVYLSGMMKEKREGIESTSYKKDQLYDVLRTSFLYQETSFMVMETYFEIAVELRQEDTFFSDMVKIIDIENSFNWKENKALWIDIITFYTPQKLQHVPLEEQQLFMNILLCIYEALLEYPNIDDLQEEQQLAEGISEYVVYFYRKKDMKKSMFWMNELLRWKGISKGGMLSIWCADLQKRKSICDSVQHVANSSKTNVSNQIFQHISRENISWLLYYGYLWNQIYREETSIEWLIEDGEIVPNLDVGFIKKSKNWSQQQINTQKRSDMKSDTNIGIKSKTIKNHKNVKDYGLAVRNHDLLQNTENRTQKIIFSKFDVIEFLEQYYLQLFAFLYEQENYNGEKEEAKMIILFFHNWSSIYENTEMYDDKSKFLKQIVLDLIRLRSLCVDFDTLSEMMDSSSSLEKKEIHCVSEQKDTNQTEFSLEERAYIAQLFSTEHIVSLEKWLYGEAKNTK